MTAPDDELRARFDETIPGRESPRGHYGSPSILAMDGLARQRHFTSGAAKPPAVHHLFGLTPTRASPGRATFSAPASPWLLGTAGVFHGGVAPMVADAPLSSSVITELGPNQIVTTAALSFDFVRPADPSAGRIVAESTSEHVGRNLGLSSCEVTDAAGRLLAYGIARHVVLSIDPEEQASDVDPTQQVPVDEAATYDGPDPWERPVEGEVLSPELWDRPGLELAEAWCADELPRPPYQVLTGCTPVDCREGWVRWIAPASGWWCSPAPYLYGGMLAMFAESTLSAAFTTVSPAGRVAAVVDLNVRFLRPVFPDGGVLDAQAEVVHAGRNLRVATCEIHDGRGKLAVLAEASAVLVPPTFFSDAASGDAELPTDP
ncbi:MAG: PaaI family thioesterase [Nitriliruptorales bacterium]|nr:PaaI family thioesterase [Nitriliruptorales bacterium]